MSEENIREFISQVQLDDDLKLKIRQSLLKYKSRKDSKKLVKEFIKKKIIPLSKQIRLDFTEKEFLSYLNKNDIIEMSNSDLENISGGISIRKLASTFGALPVIYSAYSGVKTHAYEYNLSSVSKYENEDIGEIIVSPGDSLWKIASILMGDGNNYNQIMDLNDLKSVTIHPGQILKVPIDKNILDLAKRGFYVTNSEYGGYKLSAYVSLEQNVVIPDSITSIESGVFQKNNNIRSVTIPSSVKIIKDSAFKKCKNLESVYINAKIKNMDFLFWGCSSLKEVQIPDSVVSLNGTFNGCSSLENIKIPSSVNNIGYNSFRKCSSIKSIEFPESIISIDVSAFELCSSLKKVSLPSNIKYIRPGAFKGCSLLEEITLPKSLLNFSGAFLGCSSLKNVNIECLVASIGSNTFSGCSSLQSIVLPKTVKSIGNEAFSGCTSLTSINIPDLVRNIGEGAFSGCINIENVNIPSNIKEIGNFAFYKCHKIKSVNIPRDVGIGKSAFPLECSLNISKPVSNAHILEKIKKAHEFICECIKIEKERGTDFKKYFTGIGDGISKILNQHDKFSELPKVVSDEEFNKISKDQTILYRGISDSFNTNENGISVTKDASELADEFKYGRFFNGNGIFGNGTYTSVSLSTAKTYTNYHGKPIILKMILDKSANIIEYDDLMEISEYYRLEHVEYSNSVKSGKYKYEDRIKRLADLGHLAESLSYDAIHVGPDCTSESDYYVILNRGKVIVSKDNAS